MITVKDLSYSVGSRIILNHINLNFSAQAIYGIIGPNGAGKSTLLKHMMRIIEPPAQTIFIEGSDIRTIKTKDYAKKCSFVFQENPRDIDFTVEEVMEMGRYPYLDYLGQMKESDHRIIENITKELFLEPFLKRSMLNLSGGEAQKVFIGRALAQQTPVLLLDEPISMLDIHNSIELLNCLKAIKDKHQLTIIMVLHDLNLAFQYCDHIVLMNQGEVVLADTREKVLESEHLQQVYHYKLKVIKEQDATYVVPYSNQTKGEMG